MIMTSLPLTFLFISFFLSPAAAQDGRAPPRHLWCVAKNNAGDDVLRSALDWTCGPGGANCGPIQQGGLCYDAVDIRRTASFALNDYYVKHGPSDENCNFGNTAALTSLNPSHVNCKFPSTSVDENFSQAATADPYGIPDLTITSSESGNWNCKLFTVYLSIAMAVLIL